MHRGKALQPERECDYCNKPLPALRHPDMKFCDPTCRQRARYSRDNITKGIKCLVCGKIFVRVGSHVVQVHGYSNVLEYKQEFGLNKNETHTKEHAEKMRQMIADRSIENLKNGKDNRYQKGGDHAEHLKKFWRNRKNKKGHIEVNSSLGNR